VDQVKLIPLNERVIMIIYDFEVEGSEVVTKQRYFHFLVGCRQILVS
jgi:hypothetical protein